MSRKLMSVTLILLTVLSLVAIIPQTVHADNFKLPKAGYVYVEYVSSEAVYINDVNLVQPYASGTPLFNTKKTRLGATKLIGYYPKDTVFEFELYVRTADPTVTYRWSSDPAKNSDGENHVHTTAIDGNTYLMEWEDKPIPPGADFDDVVMLIHIGGDEDEDGLWDIWETSGVDIDLDGTIDLPIHQAPYNADPKHKDIFLEIDWMAKPGLSHKPKQKAIDLVVAAFANAPVTNPDNKDGITLHVDMTVGGTSVPFHEYVQFEPAEPGIADFDTIKAANFDPNRRTVYHYCLFAHDLKMYPEQPSGLAERPGNDLIVSFGNWHVGATDLDKDGLPDEDVGTVLEQAGTLMHELGHNLGLRHGGNVATEYKPNYLSVMNYLFQHSGIPPTHRIDYSQSDLPDLKETSLDEHLGIQDGTDATFFYDPKGIKQKGAGTGAIDWDQDGTLEGASQGGTNVQVDINDDGQYDTLTGFDDWDFLKFLFTDTQDYEDGVHTTHHPEIGYARSVQLRAPVAEANGPYTSVEGAPITFDASGSADPEGDPLQYRWDFTSDGVWDTSYTASPTTSYTWYDDHTGTVMVEVTDGMFTDTATASVTVSNVPPTVDAGSDQTVYSGDTVQFSGSFTDPGTEDTHSIAWDFGDGSPLVTGLLTPTHVYLGSGTYTVTLTVTDDDGGVDTDTLTITVQRIPVPIDIKPGSDPNSINPKGKGLIPVAILNDDTWTPYSIDPVLVDPASVVFGPHEASPVWWAYEDVDDDGDLDLVLFFKTQETGIAKGESSATLNADLTDGRQVTGVDSILTAPRKP